MNVKIKKAKKRQEKAFSVFTQMIGILQSTNKEMDEHLIELEEQRNKIDQEKEQTLNIIEENQIVLLNMETLLGGKSKEN